MIPNGKGRHYLTVKKISALLRAKISKHHDFYYFSCHNFFATTNKLQSHRKVCENKDLCNIAMHSEDTEILQFNQYQKSGKAPFVIYANLEYLIEKIDGRKYNPEN